MPRKLILWVLGMLAAFFAVMGGEFSTLDLWRQRKLKEKLALEADSLAKHVDSLRAQLKLIETDRATQERIAREQFGMVRGDKEILYRFGRR